MALHPTLVRSTDDDHQVNASLPGGRYRFSLTDAGSRLLCNELEVDDGAAVPWTAFKALVVAGDAYLPNASGDGVDVASELASPEQTRELTEAEAVTVAAYLEHGSYRDRELEALAELISASPLASHVSVDDLESKRDTVNGLRDIAARLDNSSTAPERNDPVRVVHVGTATLGRRNLGRSVRQADYLDAFSQAIDVAIEEEAHAMIQTGRLFQRGSPKPRTIRDAREQLERLRDRGIPFYATHSSNDRSTLGDRVPELVDEGLIKPIGGTTVTVDDEGAVCLHGIDAGLPRDQRTPAWDEASGEQPAFAGVIVEASDHPGTESIEAIDASLDATPDAYFVGGIRKRAATTYGSIPVFGPGPTENTLGKRTVIGDDPPDRYVAVYTIDDGTVDATFHELEVRDYACLAFECTTETEIDALETELAATDVRDAATMVVLTGEKHTHSPASEAVREILEEEAFCVRVWDERTEVDDHADGSAPREQSNEPDRSHGSDHGDARSATRSGQSTDGNEASAAGNGELASRSPTVLCVADLQLRGSLVPELELVLEVAEANSIDAIVHVGELFATVSPDDATIQAVERALSRTRGGPLRFCAIGGRRTVAGETDSLERLERADLERLDTMPTDVGSISVYGFDHVSGDVASRLQAEAFTWASGSSHAICCLNQSIWPAVGTRESADIAAYEVTDAVEPYLDAIVAGGTRGDHEWTDDELVVAYPGTANSELLADGRDVPVGIVFDGSDDRTLRYASIPLEERTASEPVTIDASWRELRREEPTDEQPTDPEPTNTPSTDEEVTSSTSADPSPTATTPSGSDDRPAEPLDAVRRIAATDWEVTTDEFDTTDLVDLYGILSKARSDLERQRKIVRDALLSQTEPEETLTGRYATIDHTVRTRQTLRDPGAVLDAIERAGVNPADVQSLDVSKAREALEEAGNSFDDALSTVLELAGVDPDEVASIDPEKVEKVVDAYDVDPDAVFETAAKTSIVRKSLELPEEEVE